MKRGYSEKLDGERDATLKYKGERACTQLHFVAPTIRCLHRADTDTSAA